MRHDCYCDWRGFNRTDTVDGNTLGALLYYTRVVYSVFVIGSVVDLPDVTGRLNLMCRKPLLSILSRFIHQGVAYYISGERRIKSTSHLHHFHPHCHSICKVMESSSKCLGNCRYSCHHRLHFALGLFPNSTRSVVRWVHDSWFGSTRICRVCRAR